jgi:hypothetical protein
MSENAPISADDDLMTIREAARHIHVSAATLHKRIARGVLPVTPHKHGKLVHLSDVMALSTQVQGAQTKPTRESRLAEQAETMQVLQHTLDQLTSRVTTLEDAVENLQTSVTPRKT